MKKINKLGCLLLGGVLLACSSEEDVVTKQTPAEYLDVAIAVAASDTYGTKSLGSVAEDSVSGRFNTVQVYAFRNESGELDSYAKQEVTKTGSGILGISLKVSKGSRVFYAVANAQDTAKFGKILTEADLLAQISKLENEEANSLVMVGTHAPITISDNTSFGISVTRTVSRIQFQYSIDFRNTPWEGKKFVTDSVYVTNINTKATVESGLNEDKLTYDIQHGGWFGQNTDLCDVNDGSWPETPASIGSDKWFSYYVYKNNKPASMSFKDATSIVVRGHIEGMNDPQYYTIRINTPDANVDGDNEALKNNYIMNNTIYAITALIKGSGTPVPGESVNVEICITPTPWNRIFQDEEFDKVVK